MPPRDTWCHYVEPFFGGGAVLLANDPEGLSEVVNDLDRDLTCFWRVLQHTLWFEEFHRRVQAVPFSEVEWTEADDEPLTAVDRAVNFFIRVRQSLAGRRDGFAAISRNRTRRGMNEQASAWLNAVDGLPAVHARLRRVVIVGPKDALEVIRQQDGPKTVFYLDPPYLHETRATTGEYEHEMTAEQHTQLLSLLTTLKGRFLLSGYRSHLYDGFAEKHGWNRHEFDLPNNSAGGNKKRRMKECVWTSY
jgi:DNA adenine methylase